MKRAQSTWLTSALATVPAFPEAFLSCWTLTDMRLHQSCSATARHTLCALLHWRQLHPSSFSCHSGGGGLGHQSDSASRNIQLLARKYNSGENSKVGWELWLCSGSNYSQVEKLTDLSDWHRSLKRLLEEAPSLPELGSQLRIQGAALPPDFLLQIPSCLTPSSKKKVRHLSSVSQRLRNWQWQYFINALRDRWKRKIPWIKEKV